MLAKFDKNPSEIKADIFIFLCGEGDNELSNLTSNIKKTLKVTLPKAFNKQNGFEGKEAQTEAIYTDSGIFIISGTGKKEQLSLEKIRKSSAKAIKKAEMYNKKSAAFATAEYLTESFLAGDIACAQAETCHMALYSFGKYKAPKKDKKKIEKVNFFSIKKDFDLTLEKGIKTGNILGLSTNFARDLGNEPSNELYPETFAQIISMRGKEKGYEVKIHTLEDLISKKMGGILAVGQGSRKEPRLIEMHYNGSKDENEKPIVLVGKGVVFDSGGISIKPSAGMDAMKIDMGGAAAVSGVFDAISLLKLPINVVGLIPAVENMPDGAAYKPGDVVTSYKGLTIDVGNTDAEGRIILADALTYASEFNPRAVIDLATLTGATLVALGTFVSSAMTNSPELMRDMYTAGQETFERVWELPLWDEYDKMIDSDIADVANMGNTKGAGTIIAGMFLKRFVGDHPWIHLDIAGTGISSSVSDYIPKHSTGVGVRLVTRFLMNSLS
ncbi:leucyl aminopeptidase [soil metagenome]